MSRHIETVAGNWRMARRQACTDGYPTRAFILGRDNFPQVGNGDATTQTTERCILFPGGLDNQALPNGIVFMPFGSDAANETFKMRVLGWKLVEKPQSHQSLWMWVYEILIEITATLGAKQGLAGGPITSSQFVADGIAIVGTAGDSNTYSFISPADDQVATFGVDLRGCQAVEVLFDTNSSAATANALYHWIY